MTNRTRNGSNNRELVEITEDAEEEMPSKEANLESVRSQIINDKID